MAAPVLQFKRGAFSNLPALKAGEPGFTTDKYDLYVGLDNNSANNKFFGSHRYWKRETTSTGSGINLVEGSSTGDSYITLSSPDSLAGIVTYYFPGSQGVSNSVLTNDGNGNLTWGSGSANPVFTGVSTFSDTTQSTSKDTGAVIVDGGIGIEKNAYVGGLLAVTGVATVTSDLTVGGATTIAGNLYVGGQSEFIGIVTFRGGTINLGDAGTDDVVVGGEFASDLIPTTDVTYNLGSSSKKWADIYARSANLSGNLNVTGFSTFNGLVVGNNGIDVAGFSTIYNLHVLDDLSVNGIFEVDESFASHGNSVLSGIVSFTGTTQSTTYDDGAVVIDGGVGVQKNLNVGGNLNVTGNVTIGGTFVALRGQDVYIENKDIILGYTTSITPNDDTANHAGVAIASSEGSPLVSFTASGINTLPDTYKQLMWFKSGTLGFATDTFAFNYALAIGTTSMANGVRLAVGSGITMTDTEISATTFRGTLVGNVSSADQIKTVSAADNNATYNITFVDSNNGSATNESVYTDDGIFYNPGTNTFTTQHANFTGNVAVQGTLTGTATTATRATTVDTTATSTNADYFVPFVDTLAGENGETVRVGAGLSLNPSTGEVKTAGVLSVGSPAALTSYIKGGSGSNAMFLYGNGDVSFQAKVIANNIRSSSNASDTLTLSDLDATFARNLSVAGIATVTGEFVTGTNATIGGDITIGGNDIKASDGTTAITLTASTGAVGVSSDLTVSGSLFVRGTTTEVNTETLKVEDSLIEVGLVNSGGSLVPPSSDLNIDVGVLFHYYTSSAKKAGVYWDDSVSRVVISSDLSESSSVITSSTYAPLEIGSLWVTDCAGTSQVISCTGSERFLENITVDGGSF